MKRSEKDTCFVCRNWTNIAQEKNNAEVHGYCCKPDGVITFQKILPACEDFFETNMLRVVVPTIKGGENVEVSAVWMEENNGK